MIENFPVELFTSTLGLALTGLFVALWWFRNKRTYVLLAAIGFGMMTASLVHAQLSADPLSWSSSLVRQGLFTLSAIATISAVRSRAELPLQLPLLVFFGAVSLGANAVMRFLDVSFELVYLTANLPFGYFFALAGWSVLQGKTVNTAQRVLCASLFGLALQFVIRPLLLLNAYGTIVREDFQSSAYWLGLNVTAALFATLLALSFLAVCLSDVRDEANAAPVKAT